MERVKDGPRLRNTASKGYLKDAERFLGRTALVISLLALSPAPVRAADNPNQGGNPDNTACDFSNLQLPPECVLLADQVPDVVSDGDPATIASDSSSENPPVAEIVPPPTQTATPATVATPAPAATAPAAPAQPSISQLISMDFRRAGSLTDAQRQQFVDDGAKVADFNQNVLGFPSSGQVIFNIIDGPSPDGAPAQAIGNNQINFWTGSISLQEPGPLEEIGHEYTHTGQGALYRQGIAQYGSPQLPRLFRWMDEATADYYAMMGVDRAYPNQELFAKYLRCVQVSVRQNPNLDLSKLLTIPDMLGKPSSVYSLAVLSYSFLVTQESPKLSISDQMAALTKYYIESPKGSDLAFKDAWGIDLARFYSDFADYKSSLAKTSC